jgi:glycosylphosphatidylinositol transamidase
MTSPTTFLKIGSFLPSAVIISVAMMFTGLYEWVNAAWILDDTPAVTTEKVDAKDVMKKPRIRIRRPVLQALGILIATHILGLLLFSAISKPIFAKYWMVSSPISIPVT